MNTIMKKSEANVEGHSGRKLEVSIFVGSFSGETPSDNNSVIALTHTHAHSDNAWIKEAIFIPEAFLF